jgi:hypothetical protein
VRTPFVVIGVLIVALLGLDAAIGGSGQTSARAKVPPVAAVPVIATRVEAVRGLRFRTVPRAQRVSPAQARRDGLEDFDRSYPKRRLAADEEMLGLLGLVPEGLKLRDVSASLFGEGVAGYYDPRTKKLRTVTGPATGTRVLAEVVMAHELTHALEDQRYDLLDDVERQHDDTDAGLARLSLIEGSATAVMNSYMTRYFSAEEVLGGTLASAFADTGDVPAFLQAQLVFPYLGGASFVTYLRERAGGSWALVDTAERVRPPASTEQVLHPPRYLQADEPKPVALRIGRALGTRWTRAASGTWGELQTREMLADSGGGGAEEAAAGWGGDRWELWRSRPLGDGCAAPCRDADVLVMRWRWDSTRDEQQFAARLRAWVRDGLAGKSDGADGWDVPAGGAAAIASAGGAVTLALAPDLVTARRVATAR